MSNVFAIKSTKGNFEITSDIDNLNKNDYIQITDILIEKILNKGLEKDAERKQMIYISFAISCIAPIILAYFGHILITVGISVIITNGIIFYLYHLAYNSLSCKKIREKLNEEFTNQNVKLTTLKEFFLSTYGQRKLKYIFDKNVFKKGL